jgi:hypothetical protein
MLLCCMKRFFDFSKRDMTKIFNSLYETKIRNEGFPDGLPRSTITTQWEDIRRKRHPDFILVHRDVSFAQGPVHFAQLLGKIRFAAGRLHIGLVARARDLEITVQERAIQSERRAHTSSIISEHASSIISEERRVTSAAFPSGLLSYDRQLQTTSASAASAAPVASSAPVMPTVSTASAATPGVRIIILLFSLLPPFSSFFLDLYYYLILTIMQNTQTSEVPAPIARIRSYALQSGTHPPTRPSNVPTLLWRFSNDESMGINHRSGYIANAFINEIGNMPSPEERAAEFPTWLEIHVRPRKIPSPFISTSVDPLVPMHRALTQGKNAFVSLIDSSQINPEHIFYMKDLMRQYNVYTPGYRGAKEYIIWGAIGRGAIVTSFKADQLITIANKHPDIKDAFQLDLISGSPNCKSQLYKKLANKVFESDLDAGKVVGKFLALLHLQREYINDVTLALNGSWSFTSSEDNTEFLRGAHQGYQDAATLSPFQSQLLSSQIQPPCLQSQASASQSQSELDCHSLNDESTSHIDSHNQDIHDYVLVDRQQDQVDRTTQDQQLRQSIDRLSIHDDNDEQNYCRIFASPSPSVIARTVATRRISLFDQRSDSWVLVPDTRPSTPGREQIIQSIENESPPAQADIKPPVSCGTPSKAETQEPTFKTPTKIKRSRSESIDSESTLGPSTPARQFSRERSHVDRVLGIDWPSFWDSMQNHAQ